MKRIKKRSVDATQEEQIQPSLKPKVLPHSIIVGMRNQNYVIQPIETADFGNQATQENPSPNHISSRRNQQPLIETSKHEEFTKSIKY